MSKEYLEVRENLLKIMQKYGTPVTFVSKKTKIHPTTLNLLVHNKLEYNISEKKLNALKNFIAERI